MDFSTFKLGMASFCHRPLLQCLKLVSSNIFSRIKMYFKSHQVSVIIKLKYSTTMFPNEVNFFSQRFPFKTSPIIKEQIAWSTLLNDIVVNRMKHNRVNRSLHPTRNVLVQSVLLEVINSLAEIRTTVLTYTTL